MRDTTEQTKLSALGSAIRSVREAAGISQEQLALMTGLDRSYVSRLERGIANPSYLALCKVSNALNIRVSQIIEQGKL
jgi:transcriptional regulator with XRE-family HTH domain